MNEDLGSLVRAGERWMLRFERRYAHPPASSIPIARRRRATRPAGISASTRSAQRSLELKAPALPARKS